MFYKAANNIITITRGDTGSFRYYINLGTAYCTNFYHLKANDKLYFGILEPGHCFETAIVKKVFSRKDIQLDELNNPYIQVSFGSLDTEYLTPGTYYYAFKLYIAPTSNIENSTEQVITVTEKTKFIILD